jgi:hypothetical protein|tara:strand:- start:1551 stop:1676 length:126 start_codon:yes stop_codon:yes gene_type:complete
MLKKIVSLITYPYRKYKEYKTDKEYAKRIAELKKRDPFIYK